MLSVRSDALTTSVIRNRSRFALSELGNRTGGDLDAFLASGSRPKAHFFSLPGAETEASPSSRSAWTVRAGFQGSETHFEIETVQSSFGRGVFEVCPVRFGNGERPRVGVLGSESSGEAVCGGCGCSEQPPRRVCVSLRLCYFRSLESAIFVRKVSIIVTLSAKFGSLARLWGKSKVMSKNFRSCSF